MAHDQQQHRRSRHAVQIKYSEDAENLLMYCIPERRLTGLWSLLVVSREVCEHFAENGSVGKLCYTLTSAHETSQKISQRPGSMRTRVLHAHSKAGRVRKTRYTAGIGPVMALVSVWDAKVQQRTR